MPMTSDRPRSEAERLLATLHRDVRDFLRRVEEQLGTRVQGAPGYRDRLAALDATLEDVRAYFAARPAPGDLRTECEAHAWRSGFDVCQRCGENRATPGPVGALRAAHELRALLACDGWHNALANGDDLTEWVGPFVHGALDALEGR